jgi:hypothetical protein
MSYLADGPELPTVTRNGRSPNPLPPYRGFPQLFIEESSDNHLLYRIGDHLYEATNLTPNEVPRGDMIFEYIMTVQPGIFTSQPLFVKTQTGYHIFITNQAGDLYEIRDEQLISIVNQADLPPENVESIITFQVPQLIQQGIQPEEVKPLLLNGFNRQWYERLVRLLNNDQQLNRLDVSPVFSTTFHQKSSQKVYSPPEELIQAQNWGRIGESQQFQEEFIKTQPLGRADELQKELTQAQNWGRIGDSKLESNYETLLKQLYGLPMTLPKIIMVNGLPTPIITYEEAVNSIQSGLIDNYIVDPYLQPWAGPPQSKNRMVTLFYQNGNISLVKAQYKMATNEIFPPV